MLQAPVQRVGPNVARAFVHGALHHEGVGPRTQAAPGACVHGQALGGELDALLGHVVRHLCAARHAAVARQVGQGLHPHRHGGGCEQDVAAGQRMPPVGDAPALHAGPHTVAGGRALEALGKLLRAAPLHLDGRPHSLGEHGGLQLHRAQRAAAKAAAEERVIEALAGKDAREQTREMFRGKLRRGELDATVIELDIADPAPPQMMGGQGMEMQMQGLQDLFKAFGTRTSRKKVTIADSYDLLLGQEADKLLDDEAVRGRKIKG